MARIWAGREIGLTIRCRARSSSPYEKTRSTRSYCGRIHCAFRSRGICPSECEGKKGKEGSKESEKQTMTVEVSL